MPIAKGHYTAGLGFEQGTSRIEICGLLHTQQDNSTIEDLKFRFIDTFFNITNIMPFKYTVMSLVLNSNSHSKF